jgi:hypothetical protein
VFPAYRGQTIPPEVAAAQFGTQILIQPLIAGSNQDTFSGQAYEDPDSVIYEIAAETGKVYTPCSAPGCAPYENALAFVESTAKREIYQYNKPAGYIDEISNFAQAGLDTVSVLSAITGTDVTAMPNLLPSYRGNAYRYIQGRSADIQGIIDGSGFQKLPAAERMAMRRYARLLAEGEQIVEPEAEDTLEKVLGGLNAWDAYIIGCNMTAFETFYENSASRAGYDITPASVSTGNLFLQNLALVRTFITDSDLDLVIYSPAIAGSLETYTAIVDDVVWNAETDDGYIDVFYKPGSLQDVTTPYKRTIHYPRYSQSGHMVSLAQPEKFFNDVKDWLED